MELVGRGNVFSGCQLPNVGGVAGPSHSVTLLDVIIDIATCLS
jgi:hypothetical protein